MVKERKESDANKKFGRRVICLEVVEAAVTVLPLIREIGVGGTAAVVLFTSPGGIPVFTGLAAGGAEAIGKLEEWWEKRGKSKRTILP